MYDDDLEDDPFFLNQDCPDFADRKAEVPINQELAYRRGFVQGAFFAHEGRDHPRYDEWFRAIMRWRDALRNDRRAHHAGRATVQCPRPVEHWALQNPPRKNGRAN